MGEAQKDVIMSHIRRDVLENTLSKGTRFDGRTFDQIRELDIQIAPVKSAEGSALVRLGDTKVLGAVKFDIVKPFADRPREGVLTTNAELLPAASASFEPGPPNENCVELARVVDRAIRSAECVDLKGFFIEEEKVLGIYVDLYVLDHAGNYTDAATLAATAALLNTKMPKLEDGKLIRGEFIGPLKVAAEPVSTTMIKINDYWLMDPSRDEERAQETSITISTTKDHVCAIQKRMGSLSKQELMDNIEKAFKTGNEIRNILKR